MRARRDDYITQPFVLDPDNLQRLADALLRFIGPISISVRCADKIEREFASTEEALAFENPPARSISSLTLRARAQNWEASASLRFSGESQRNINVDLQGDEDSVLKLNEAIGERLSAMRPWYWPAARTSTFLVLWFLYVYFSLVQPLFRQYVLKQGTGTSLDLGAVNLTVMLLAAVLGALSVSFARLVDRLKRLVFPMGVFALGQGQKRHADMDTVRTVVVVSFVISVVAGIVTSILF